ncbi:MAG TPA: methylamine utilization protein [Thermoanaerobaculia bacterium]
MLLIAFALPASAATIVVDVRDPQGAPLRDAVVYAAPEGRGLEPATRTAVMDQKDRTFVPHVLPVQTGTAVKFPNSDDIQHEVYSFSPAKTFQLPLYKGTPANPIVFTTAGVVTLGCNIHDKMNAYIVILDTPYFAKTEAGGRVEVRIPAGKYAVHVWHPDMRDEPTPQSVSIGEGDRSELAFTVTAAPAALTSAPLNRLEEKFKKYGNARP